MKRIHQPQFRLLPQCAQCTQSAFAIQTGCIYALISLALRVRHRTQSAALLSCQENCSERSGCVAQGCRSDVGTAIGGQNLCCQHCWRSCCSLWNNWMADLELKEIYAFSLCDFCFSWMIFDRNGRLDIVRANTNLRNHAMTFKVGLNLKIKLDQWLGTLFNKYHNESQRSLKIFIDHPNVIKNTIIQNRRKKLVIQVHSQLKIRA